jgi:hypothetical protein
MKSENTLFRLIKEQINGFAEENQITDGQMHNMALKRTLRFTLNDSFVSTTCR